LNPEERLHDFPELLPVLRWRRLPDLPKPLEMRWLLEPANYL
jgi:hypothetical protein